MTSETFKRVPSIRTIFADDVPPISAAIIIVIISFVFVMVIIVIIVIVITTNVGPNVQTIMAPHELA